MNRVKTILVSIVILLSQLSIPAAAAGVTDYVSFPYNETTFDSMTRYGLLNYTDSLVLGMWNRIRKGPAPFNGELTLYFTQNVNIKTYTFQTELISPSGKSIPLIGRQDTTENTYSEYCWGTYCKSTYLIYSVALPENSEVGKYDLRFTAKWLGSNCVGTVCESGVTKSQSTTALGALEITGATPAPTPTLTATPTATPTPASTPTPTATSTVGENIPVTKVTGSADSDGGITCYVADFTKEAVDAYGIIGTHWKISSNNSNSGRAVLDEYDWGIGVKNNGDPITEITASGGKVSIIDKGVVFYGYKPRNQVKGSSYECSVAIRTSKGVGPYATETIFSKVNTKNFNPIEINKAVTSRTPTTSTSVTPSTSKGITITCVAGKLTRKITATKPVCPSGFKRK